MGHPAQGIMGERNRGENHRLRVIVNAAPAHQTVARIGILLIQRIASLENDVTRLKRQSPAAIIPPVKVAVPTVKLASVKPRRIFQSGLVKPAATAKSHLADSICITVNNVPETIVTEAPANKGKGRR